MATSSTLPSSGGLGADIGHLRTTRFLLRLRDLDSQADALLLPLGASAGGHTLDVAEEGFVHESHRYQAALLSTEDVPDGRVWWSINDEEPVEMQLRRVSGQTQCVDGQDYLYYQLFVPGSMELQPFAMAYGFARVSLFFVDTGFFLSTRDVACACDRDDQEVVIAEILETLMSGGDTQVMDWMLEPVKAEARRNTIVEGGKVADASASLPAFVALCRKIVSFYEGKLNFFCTQAYARTVKASVQVAPSKVRRLGRQELLWLSRNPEVLGRTSRPSPICVDGQAYLPSKVQTEFPRKTYDVEENRAVLAFLEHVSKSLSAVLDYAEDGLIRMEQTEHRLSSFGEEDDEGLVLPLIVLRLCLRREAPLVEEVRSLRRRARRVSAAFRHALPEVKRVRYRLPRRTKPFQEIPAYLELFLLMKSWDDFGEFQMLRDGMLLATCRMDKLYEYYVLHELLSGLKQRGFALDFSQGEPCRQVNYSLSEDDRYFENEDQVANMFKLRSGDVRLALCYQPVLYGGVREEHGVCVHRTTVSRSYGESYWTPDYLLLVEGPGKRRVIVIDAKFRPVSGVKFSTDAAGGCKESTFQECLRKYKLESVCSDGSPVDSLWLLCGRALHWQCETLQQSSWALANDGFVPDGIATVAPGANAIGEFLNQILRR